MPESGGDGSDAAPLSEARRRGYRALDAALERARERVGELSLWDAAETIARAEHALPEVAQAYAATILAGAVDAALCETLGRRLLRLEDECILERSVILAALERVLELAPSARWALEHVTLTWGARTDWDRLFALYDGAIDAADCERVRSALLVEAASVARDLARDPDRAIRYLTPSRRREPGHPTPAAREDLDERLRRIRDLVELLDDRDAPSCGAVCPSLERRAVAIRLEAGRVEEAATALESMLVRGTPVAGVTDLLERVALHPGQSRALDRLFWHYASVGRIDHGLRVNRLALARAATVRERVECVRRMVRLRVQLARSEGAGDADAATAIAGDAGGDPGVETAAYRALLVHALSGWRRAPTDDAFENAADTAFRAIDGLRRVYVRGEEKGRAALLLERGARLGFDRSRQRDLLHQAAVLYADDVGDAPRALRLVNELFEENDADAIALRLFDRFAALLEAAGRDSKLAMLWEAAARRAVFAARPEDERARGCFVRAGSLWERAGEEGRALAAYARGAALDSREAYEALARIHAARGRWREARVALEWLCEEAPANAMTGYVLSLAEAHFELGETERACSCVEALLRSAAGVEDASAARAHARLKDLYRRAGKFRLLGDRLEEEARHSDDRVAAALLVEAADVRRTRLDDPAAAIRLLELAAARDPEAETVRLKLAEIFAGEDRWHDVVEVLSTKTARHRGRRSPERAVLHERLADALLRLGRRREALAELHEVAKLAPTDPAIHLRIGVLARECGDAQVAERALRAVLLAAPSAEGTACVSRVQLLVELAEMATQRDDAIQATNLLESAFDAAREEGDDAGLVDQALRTTGRYALLAEVLEWRTWHAEPLSARAAALRELTRVWREHLECGAVLENRIRRRARQLVDSLDAGHKKGGVAHDVWAELCAVGSSLEDEPILFETVRRQIAAADRTPPGVERASLRIGVARTLLDRGVRLTEAIEQLMKALGEDPGDTETATLLSIALERAGRFDDAARALETRLPRLSARSPGYVEATWQLGGALELAGRREDAARLYESLLDGDGPGDEGPLANLHDVRRLAGKLEAFASPRLADCLERLCLLDPSAAGDRAPMLVELRRAEGDDRAVVRALELAVAAFPSNAAPLDELVRTYEEKKNVRAARRIAEGLVARAERTAVPAEKTALLLRAARLFIENGDAPERALEPLQVACAARPESAEAALAYARLQASLGRPRAGIDVLERIVTGAPAAKPPLLTDVYLELAKAHLAGDELVEAFDRLRAGFAADRRRPELALLLGLVAIDLGQEATAERALLAVTSLTARDGSGLLARTALIHLAALAEARGDILTARSWAAKATLEETTPQLRSEPRQRRAV